jgi:type II secretory pathway component PulF
LTAGAIEADSSKTVALELEKLGYTPVSINSVENIGISSRIETWLASFQKVKVEELIVFTRQLSSILEAGVPLVEGLDAVQEQLRNKTFRQIIITVKNDIEGGASFSDALEKHVHVFSKLMVSMVRAGERAGILDDVLNSVSNLFEKDLETVNRIKSATRYPMIVGGALVMAFVGLTTFIIPRFAKFFAAFDTELPLPTRILIGLNKFIVSYWFIILGILFVLVYVFRRAINTEKGRYSWDRVLLSVPIFGPLFAKVYLSRFSRMLAAMIRSGIPILQALEITSATVENKVISKVILDVRTKVSEGKTLAEPMKGSKVFPPIAIAMVSIGEKSGTLEKMLTKVADFFDRETDYTVNNLTPLLEPVLIFGLGMLMLVFALGIFLPMWDLVKVYKTY